MECMPLLQAQWNLFTTALHVLQEQGRSASFCIERFKNCDEDFMFYTGLPGENELFLLLVRLCLGLFEADLAHRFSIAQSTVSRIGMSWLNFLYAKLSSFPLWALRETTDAMMPGDFVKKDASTRVILDATEVQCEVPTSLSL
ncbi:uncharacterized protein LOC120836984 [Ixodes scapularis]|uniref:uncharacterized protein LOC120836984 n=1 Tax=Ixodes scapularis TaxID=6945 RepID=UPI001A9FC9D3|nr:uncharacterized protein LOC120836984 [Ixodes scapularis]